MVVVPFHAPRQRYKAVAAVGRNATFVDDFEQNRGWTVTTEGELTNGGWERGTPNAGGFLGDPPFDGDGSGSCFVTGNRLGDSDVDGGTAILTSPLMDATEGDAHLSYRRWFANNRTGTPGEDVLTVSISNDGGATRVALETVGPDGEEVSGGWIRQSFRVADYLAPTTAMRLRFTVADEGDDSLVEAAIDDVSMNRTTAGFWCQPCALDFDGNRLIGPGDVRHIAEAWSGGDPRADLDGNGRVDLGDLLFVVGAYGPCPD
jgi:hypothetical protein